MNNQTEPIEIPGISHSCVEVKQNDLIKICKRFEKMKKEEPRHYTVCLESLKLSTTRNTSITKKIFSAISKYDRASLVVDGITKRVVDHLEYGEQLIKKPN